MQRFLNIWLHSLKSQAQADFASRLGVILFTVGKILRFAFFTIFIFLILGKTNSLGGYSLWDVVFFYATFNLIDIIPQMLLRSVYRFKSIVVSGNFDFYLVQPISPLFRALFGGSDVLDFPMLIIAIGFIIYSGMHLPSLSVLGIIMYLLLVLNALLIALSFHVFVIALGAATTEVDSTIMLYRDLTQMGRVPISVYTSSVSFILTFVVPIGIMMSFPVQALLGVLSLQFIIYSFIVGTGFFLISILIWKTAIKHYSSASS